MVKILFFCRVSQIAVALGLGAEGRGPGERRRGQTVAPLAALSLSLSLSSRSLLLPPLSLLVSFLLSNYTTYALGAGAAITTNITAPLPCALLLLRIIG